MRMAHALVQALGDGLDERPTHAEVAAKHDALQQQLGDLTAELEAVKVRLRGAGQDVQHLKDWQVGALQPLHNLDMRIMCKAGSLGGANGHHSLLMTVQQTLQWPQRN